MLTRLLRALRSRLFWLRLEGRNRGQSPRDIFSRYWSSNHWRNAESRSGDGSTLAYTARLREQLPLLISRYRVRSMLDLPCGDFNWFRHVELPASVDYIGADIVGSSSFRVEPNRSHPLPAGQNG